jgi:hypothetical protein
MQTKKNKKTTTQKGVMHSTLWGSSAYSKLTESILKNHGQITEKQRIQHSPSSHIVNMRTKQKKRCYAFHPSSLMMPGNSASKLTESRLITHR